MRAAADPVAKYRLHFPTQRDALAAELDEHGDHDHYNHGARYNHGAGYDDDNLDDRADHNGVRNGDIRDAGVADLPGDHPARRTAETGHRLPGGGMTVNPEAARL